MPQVIDGSKKNFNTTVVGASVTVIAQYNVRGEYARQYYPNGRAYEFGNRPVDGVNYNSFITPLVIAYPTTRLLTSATIITLNNSFNYQRIQTPSTVYGYSTSTKLFTTGTNSISIPVNRDGAGVGIINTVTNPVYLNANIYGVELITTATYAFAIEQLSSTQTSGLTFGTIISANTNSSSFGSFGDGTVYVYTVTNSTSIIAVANTATVAPTNGSILGITPTGGTYTPPPVQSIVADILVVAGGGSGGNNNTTNGNGGGGGGGVLYATGVTLSSAYDVIVGAGGVAIANSTNANGNKGGNSSFGTYIAQGGGGGGSTGQGFDGGKMNGGSGGGSAYQNGGGSATQTSVNGAAAYGNAGGTTGYTWTGAGGGGAGGAGVNGSGSAPGGNGGAGKAFDISGTWRWYAGGGGGGGNSSERAGDGFAGGGRGAGTTTYYNYNVYTNEVNATTTGSGTPNAIAGTGGGGGGGSYWAANGGWSSGSGSGGSGIVIVRYPGSQRCQGGTVTTAGTYTIHTFTATGVTFTFSASAGTSLPTFRTPLVGPWTFTITGMSSSLELPSKSVISVVERSATLGTGNVVYVTNTGTSSITVSAFGGSVAPTTGILNAIYATGEIIPDTTITSVTATSTTSWEFNVIGIKGTGYLSVAAVVTATSVTGSFGLGNTVLVKSILNNTQIICYVTGTTTPIAGTIVGPYLTGLTGSLPAQPGDATYITTGTYSWVAPAGVTSVSVVAVGGGGGGGSTWSSGGGGGGGLGWKNNISVTPGQTYTVVVGSGGESTANANNNSTNLGGTSYFISTATVAGYGGGRGGPNATSFGGGYGGGYQGDGGGRGGNGAFDGSWNYGGAGAGGYTGRGADSYGGSSSGNAAPAGGGGGTGGWYSSTYGVPAGGGVGIYGQGSSGGASGQFYGGFGGSGGEQGRGGEGSGQSGFKTINGGKYGGGGGGSGTSYGGGWGGQGAVRIIWGTGRAFPTSNVTEITGAVAAVVTPFTKSSTVGGPSYDLRSPSIKNSPKLFQQNHVPNITGSVVYDTRRLTLERKSILQTGYFLRVNVPSETYGYSPARLFNTGTLAFTKFYTTSSTSTSISTQVNSEINPSTTGTFVYRVTPITSSSWIFRIYNISSSTVSSLTATSIITATTSSGKLGSFGVGSTVTVSTVTSPTSIIAVAYGGIGSLAPTAGLIDSISVPGGTYTPPVPVETDQNYTAPGTYTFIVPSNATTLSVMAVGAGGAGDDGNSGDGGGGGGSGGSAGFFNNLSVTPGQTLTIVVGLGGIATATKNTKAPDGGLSSVAFGSFTMTVPGGIGGTPYSTNPGAPAPAAPSFANTPGGVTTGGYAGGPGGAGWDGGGGGGGAGGLGGAGGNGSTSYSPSGTLYQSGFNGGAGAGGGGAASFSAGTGGSNSGYSGGAGGAGQNNVTGGGGGGSATYTPIVSSTNGGAGNGLSSAGSRGGEGGFPGGGGGGSWDGGTGLASSGGNGFVRLVWAGTVQAYTGSSYSGVSLGNELLTPPGATKLLGIQFNGGAITISGSYSLTTTGSLTFPTTGGVQNTGHATGWNMASNYLRINELTTVASNWSKTYVAWYKGTQTASGGSYSPSVPIFSDPANSIYWGLGISSGKICVANATQNVGTTLVNTNNWFCLAWVVKSNYQVDAYVNGVKELTNIAVNSSYPGTSYIGNGYPYAGTEAPTALDAIQVISGELTAAQILEIYTAGIASGSSSGVTIPTPLENKYFGVQSAFVSVVSVSSATIRDYNVGTLTNILSVTSDTTPGLITSVSGTNPWTLTIQQLRSTAQFTTGTIVRSTPLGGSFGGNTVIVTEVNSSTSITCIAQNGTLAPTTGTIVGIYSAGPDIGNYIGPVTGVSTLTNTSSYSVSFNGSTSFLQIAHSTNFNLNNLAWTAECWIRPDGDYSAYRAIFCKRVTSSGTTSYEGFLRISTGVISFYNGTEYNSSYTLTAGVWSHCAWVYTGSTLNIYVNGSLVYSVAISMGADNTEPFLIGNARGYSEYFNGYLSNFRLVKGLAVYTGNFTPTTSTLATTQISGTNIAPISTGTYTVLLTCQSTSFIDNSSYNNTITQTSAVVSVINPFTPITTIAPYTFTISGLTSTNAFIYGSIITATNMVGSLGTATVYVTSVLNSEQITCLSTATATSGRIGTVSTTGAVMSFSTVTVPYETITLVASGNLTVTNNGTTDVTVFKTSGSINWDNQAYISTGFTAPVTMEFYKQAAATDNGASYAMIGWNADPTANASYDTIDWAAYPYQSNNFNIHHNGSNLGDQGGSWNPANKFYIVYTTDGYIKHYNGSKLLYSVFKGTGQTVYFDSSFYSVNSTFGGFSNIRIKKSEWLGTDYSTGVALPIINYAPISTSTIYTGFGARSGPAASVLIAGANASETPVIRQRFSALPSDNGNDSMIVTITANSPYAEGNLIGNQATEPVGSYTRDTTVAYGKSRWVIPEYQGFLYGGQQAATVSVNAAGHLGNYVRTADNAKIITTTTRATFSASISIGVDSGAVGTIGTVIGSGPWIFDITGLSSTVGFATKDILSAQARVGNLGQGNIVYITVVNTSSYSISCLAYGSVAPTPGAINSIYSTGELELDPTISSISTITTASWSFTVIGLKGTSNYTAGSIVTITTSSVSGGNGGDGNTVVVSAIGSINQITCYSTGTSTPKLGVISGVVPTGGTGSYPTAGDATYVTTGTYSWTAPSGVTSVSVVAVGGGGGGGHVWSSGGGGGGGLGWKNNIPVTPGVSYTVVVGQGGESTSNASNLSTNLGGTSYFISTATVAGYGGGRGGPGATSFGGGYGGGFLGDGGGRGGNGAFEGSWNRGGAGAGGYAGQGADNAGGYFTAYNPPAGSGAGAASGYYSSTYGVPAGGGVGIFGKGADGVGSSSYFGGGGGSGGEQGRGGEGSGQSGLRIINGGAFGGGGGGSGTSYGGGWGGVGAVRIIWGSGRAFPATNAGAVTAVIAVATATVKSSTIGGSSYNREGSHVYTNRMPYPESIGIDRVDQIVTVDTITNDAVQLKIFAFQNLSAATAGSRSITNSLIGSENFFVAGTGTDGATVLSAYWF